MTIKTQTLGFSSLILLGIIIALSPVDKMASQEIDLQTLVAELSTGNYLQPDELAHWIIDKEPGFIVVDVRSKEDFNKYHIPGSVNIPVSYLSDKKLLNDIGKDNMIALVSNGNTKASQVWIILKQLGYPDVYVLEGGMNYWVSIFNNPSKPTANYTNDELFTYQFRTAAGPIMMGTTMAAESESDIKPVIQKKPVKRIKKKKKKKIDEGC